jgi:formate-dependent nitrite reductase cytochrome c552 subunit
VVTGEDCLACHGPTAVLANGGMSESQALGYFFTMSNGVFTTRTIATNTGAWPQVACTGCHQVPTNHPMAAVPTLGLFYSHTTQYLAAANSSALCGECHGNLHFAETDHRLYNAWASSKHGQSQTPVAGELSQSHAGESPEAVIQGENCIGCHAPTAVLANGGMSEGRALGYFFSATNGVFTTNTVPAHVSEWPNDDCTNCHDPHDPRKLSYFNSGTAQYQVMTNSAQLCGQCHGNLRFPDTDHRSYNLMTGTGGIGVTNQVTVHGVTCTDCHMYSSDVDPSNSKSFHGHTWAITVTEADGSTTTSCSVCHTNMDTAAAHTSVAAAQDECHALDDTVQANVTRAAAALQGTTNSTWLAVLQEAQFNLSYAESDESGGFHNHKYLIALLNDANANALALPVLSGDIQGTNLVISWTGRGTLQLAGSIVGPWNDLTNAVNPLVVPLTPQLQTQFYRLRP